MSRKIHELRGILTLNSKGFVNGVRKAIGATKEFRQAWGKAGKDVATVGKRMIGATAAFAGFAVKEFAEFESVMVRVRGVTNTLGKEGAAQFKILEDRARQMGATTRFTATQAAEAMENLGLAGLNVKEIYDALPGALQLASAAQVDIATAADVAAKTMRSFGMEASQLSEINDTLVATFTRSNTDLRQLAEAIKPVGPVAASLGIKLSTVTAALGKLSDAGFQGSEAGTALRNILSRFAGAVPEVSAKLRKLGIDIAYTRDGSMDFIQTMRNMQAAGLETGEVMALFGMRGGPGMAALLQVGIDSIAEFEEGTKKLRGVAKRLEQAQLNTFAGQFDLLKSAISEVVISIGQRLAPVFRQMVNAFTAFTQEQGPAIADTFVNAAKALGEFGVSIIQWFRDNRETVQKFISTLFGIVKWIGEFMANHPRLMAALVAFKITGLLGINKAAGSVISALGTTVKVIAADLIPALATAKGRAVAAKIAMMGLKAGLAGLAIVAIGVAAKFIYELNPAVREFRKEAERAKKLNSEWADRYVKKTQEMIDKANEFKNAGQRSNFLKAQLKDAQVALESYKNAVKSSQKRAEELRPTWRSLGQAGKKLWEEQVAQTQDFENKVQLTKDRVNELERALSQANAANLSGLEAKFEKLNQMGQADGLEGGGGMPGGGGFGEKAENNQKLAEAIASAIEAKRNARLDSEIAGTSELSGFIQQLIQAQASGAITPDQAVANLGQYASNIPGATPQNAARLAAGLTMAGEAGELTPERINELVQTFLRGIQETESKMQTAKEATRSLGERFQNLREQFPNIELNDLATKFVNIRKAFMEGKVSSEQFGKAMDSLKKQTDEAVNAAKRKEMQERREMMIRVLSGRATQADREAVARMRNARSMEIFDKQLENAFNNFIGLNRQVGNVNNNFQNLSSQMQNFGRGFQGGFGPGPGGGGFGGFGGFDGFGGQGYGSGFGGGAGGPRQDRILEAMNTTAGQIAAAYAEIQTLQSALMFLGLGPNSQKSDDIKQQIEALLRYIQDLQNQPQQFIGRSGDIPFEDPGLAEDGRSGNNGVQSLTIEAPNLTRMGQQEVSDLAAAIKEHERREGLSL